jgi:hypothetical protein
MAPGLVITASQGQENQPSPDHGTPAAQAPGARFFALPRSTTFPLLTCLLGLLAWAVLTAGPSLFAQAPTESASAPEGSQTAEAAPLFPIQATQPEPLPPSPAPRSESTAPEPMEIQAPFTTPPPTIPPTVPATFTKGQPPPPDRWWIMRELQGTWLGSLLDDNRTYFSGWTEMSYNASTAHISTLPAVFNDRANIFLLQQQWFRLEHPVVTTGTDEPSFGYHADVLVGTDYRWMLMRGLFNSQLDNSTGAQNLYGVDPVQFYVNAYFPNLFRGTEFRVGRTYNPWGYESLEAISTPLWSRSYAFFNTPFTVMALGAYTTFSPEWSGIFLLTNGNDTYLVPYQEARMFGKLTYAAANQRDNVQLGWTLGRGRFNSGAPFAPATVALAQEPAGHNNFNALDVVYAHIFSTAFSYVNESLFAWQTGVPANVPGGIVQTGSDLPGTAYWASCVHYFRFTLTDRVSSILRVETFDDFNGQRTGFRGLYAVETAGFQFRPRKGIIIRPELRYGYNGQSRPFEGKHELFVAGSDLILRW